MDEDTEQRYEPVHHINGDLSQQDEHAEDRRHNVEVCETIDSLANRARPVKVQCALLLTPWKRCRDGFIVGSCVQKNARITVEALICAVLP